MNLSQQSHYSIAFCTSLLLIAILTHLNTAKVISRKLVHHEVRFLNVTMPSVRPSKNDDYLCMAQKVDNAESFIVHFDPHADMARVHHMLLFGCTDLFDASSQLSPRYWQCGHSRLCPGMTIMYAWGRNAPALHLPDDVGFKIGSISEINYVVLQVHYAHLLRDDETDSSGLTLHYTFSPQKYIAGIQLLSSNNGVIPPRKQKYSIDINCVLGGSETIYPFAYRVHAHALGVVVTGYKYTQTNNSWTQLAKGNPQWPQAFYPTEQIFSISNDEFLAARCTYNSSSRSIMTTMGQTANDEMCNLYVMYYTNAIRGRSFGICVDVTFPDLIAMLPPGNDDPLPPNPELEEHVHNHFVNDEKVYDKKLDFAYSQSEGWPLGANHFGQITAVDVDHNGNVIIFHRGKHVWNERSFDVRNRYQLIDEGPIAANTIITIDPNSKKIIHEWGSNLFYLPHGLTLDGNGSMWLTDVALHQVFKFPVNGAQQSILTIGERFVTGNDENHFCKPTSVAISSDNGDLYIADGYCNSRVVRYNAYGKFLNQWGHNDPIGYFLSPPPGAFSIPHKIVLIEDRKLACVADREHGRIQCFSYPHGQFQFEILRDDFNGRLFSVAYSNYAGGLLYAVCGPSLFQNKEVSAFVFNVTNQELLSIFAPNSGTFVQPHDIAVAKNGAHVYVVEIGPNNLYMFSRGHNQLSNVISLSDKTTEKNKFSFHSPEAMEFRDSQSQPKKNIFISKTPTFTGPVLSEPITRERLSTNDKIDKSQSVSTVSIVSTVSTVPFPNIPISSSNASIVVSLLVVPMLIVIIISIAISVRRNGRFWTFGVGNIKGWMRGYGTPRSKEKFDLSRLINDPKKDGFNRVPMDENSDADAEENSDSEVEEFNASASMTKKV